MNAAMVLADRDWHGHMGGGAWWILIPVMLLVVAALVVGLVLALRGPRSPASHQAADEGRTARVIAMERYARGEIDAEEYDRLVARLR